MAGLLAAVAASAAGATPVCVVTPGIELCTVAGEPAARKAAEHLERVRTLFTAPEALVRPRDGVTRIVAFDSEEDYRAFSPFRFTSAHFQAAGRDEFIVAPDLNAASYPTMVHELVHVFARASWRNLPPWLEEGLAEYHSTLRPAGEGQVVVGEPPPGRVQTLGQRLPIPLDALLGAARGSPYLSEAEPGQLFYAESWALTHMLASLPRYRSGFPKLLALYSAGRDSGAALTEVYGLPLEDMRAELELYVRRGRFESRAVAVESTAPQLVVRRLSEYEWAAKLAELRAAGQANWEDIRKVFEQLASAFPARPEPWAALAARALDAGRLHDARTAYAEAIARGSSDPRVFRDYADLLAGDAPGAERIRLLRRAADQAPEDEEIRRRLALALYESLEFSEARRWMLRVRQVPPEHAAEFFRVLAYTNDQLGRKEDARAAANKAIEVARNGEEAEYSRSLLEMITRPAPQPPPPGAAPPVVPQEDATTAIATPPPQAVPPQRTGVPLYPLQGELLQVDCYGRAAVIWIRTPKGKAGFEVADVQKLVLTRGGSALLRFFPCGAQKPERVVVRYELRRSALYGTRGIARAIEFR